MIHVVPEAARSCIINSNSRCHRKPTSRCLIGSAFAKLKDILDKAGLNRVDRQGSIIERANPGEVRRATTAHAGGHDWSGYGDQVLGYAVHLRRVRYVEAEGPFLAAGHDSLAGQGGPKNDDALSTATTTTASPLRMTPTRMMRAPRKITHRLQC